MTTSTEATVVPAPKERWENEGDRFVMLTRMWGHLFGTDMSPGAWLILRMECDLARFDNHEFMRHGFSFPSRLDRFARVRLTCVPHGHAARNDEEPES